MYLKTLADGKINDELELEIVRALLWNRKFLADFAVHITPDIFQPKYQLLVESILGYWKQYAKPISGAALDQQLRFKVGFDKQDPAHEQLVNVVKLITTKPEDVEYPRDLVKDFIRFQRLENALVKSSDMFVIAKDRRDFEGLEKIRQVVDKAAQPLVDGEKLYVTMDEALSMTDESVYRLRPYLLAGGITDLFGEIKAGKTCLALEMAKAVALGEDFLGQEVQQSPVVYLTEHPPALHQVVLREHCFTSDTPIYTVYQSNVLKLNWQQVVAAAERICVDRGAGVLFIDTLPNFAGLAGENENHSGAAIEAMRPLLSIAQRGIAICQLRHARKGGGDVATAARGSSAFGGAADVLVYLHKEGGSPNSTTRIVEATGRIGRSEVAISWDAATARYSLVGTPAESRRITLRTKIMELAEERLTAKEYAQLLGVSVNTAKQTLMQLVAEGELITTGGGRHDPMRWEPPHLT